MSAAAQFFESLPGAEISETSPSLKNSGPWKAENLLISAALLLMMFLPVGTAVAQRIFGISLQDTTQIVQHLVLVVGMLGGAIAAREQRLLALSNLGEQRLPEDQVGQGIGIAGQYAHRDW